ncbi:MAG: polysaccharide biosynthesis C-terminal domain-containing protein [Devosia sp.]
MSQSPAPPTGATPKPAATRRPKRTLVQMAGAPLTRVFAGTFFVGSLSSVLILVMTIMLARQLSPDGYGTFIFATGTAALAAQFAGLGWPALMSRLIPTFRVQENWPALRALLRWGDAIVLLGALAAFILIAIAMMLPGFNKDLQAGLALTLILIFPAALTLSRRNQLAGARRPAIGIVLDEAMPPAAVILVAAVIGLSDAAPAVLTYAIAATIGATLATYFFRRALPAQTWTATPVGEPKVWMAMALPLLMGVSSRLIMNRMDILMLGPLSSLLETGYFGTAFRITYLMTYPQVILMQIITPLLSESIAANKERAMWRHFRIAIIFSVITVVPVSAVLTLFSGPIIAIVLGPEYAPAAPSLSLLAISQAFAALTIPCAGLLIASGRGQIFGLINLVAVLVNIGLNLLLIPLFGAAGAASASAVAVTLILIWQVVTILRNRHRLILSEGTSTLPDL